MPIRVLPQSNGPLPPARNYKLRCVSWLRPFPPWPCHRPPQPRIQPEVLPSATQPQLRPASRCRSWVCHRASGLMPGCRGMGGKTRAVWWRTGMTIWPGVAGHLYHRRLPRRDACGRCAGSPQLRHWPEAARRTCAWGAAGGGAGLAWGAPRAYRHVAVGSGGGGLLVQPQVRRVCSVSWAVRLTWAKGTMAAGGHLHNLARDDLARGKRTC